MKTSTTLSVLSCFAAYAASAVPTLTFISAPDGNPLYAQVQCMSGDAQNIFGNYGQGFAWTPSGGSAWLTTPGSSVQVIATSGDGQVVTGSTEMAGKRVPLRWINRVAEVLPTNDLEGVARGVSASGNRIAGYVGPLSGNKHAVSWDANGVLTYLDAGQTWTSSSANDASADGTVVAGSFVSEANANITHIALFTPTGIQDIGVPIDYQYDPPRPYQFSGDWSQLFITDDGQKVIVQLQQPATGWYKIFQWTAAGDWMQIPMPSGEVSFMLDSISGDGTSIVGMAQRHQFFYGYAWHQATGWFNIRQYLIDNGLTPLGEPIIPMGISNDGLSIAGHNGEQGFLISMTGLPCTADFNHDDIVNFFDYLDFVSAFVSDLPSANFNRDAVIDFFDYLDYVDAYSRGC